MGMEWMNRAERGTGSLLDATTDLLSAWGHQITSLGLHLYVDCMAILNLPGPQILGTLKYLRFLVIASNRLNQSPGNDPGRYLSCPRGSGASGWPELQGIGVLVWGGHQGAQCHLHPPQTAGAPRWVPPPVPRGVCASLAVG